MTNSISSNVFSLSLKADALLSYTCGQLNAFFPDNTKVHPEMLISAQKGALDRLEFCFQAIRKKYYTSEDGYISFNHLNADHYAAYIYFLANELHRQGGAIPLCEKLFYLNKVLHGLDLFYTVAMPDIFLLVHPVGTVIGSAVFGDYFVIYQNCTVGSGHEGIYPYFSEGVILYAGCSVIGNCHIGSNTVFGAGTQLISRDVPDNSVVVGQAGSLRVLANPMSVIDRAFR